VRFVRFVALAIGALVLGTLQSVVTAAPASASVTTLCKGAVACVKAGMTDSGYFFNSRTMYWRMYAGHNCTNYAAFRIVSSGLPNVRPWTGGGNATNWGTAMSRITDATPRVGSIAWWKAGVRPAGSAGHVAYVERVVSADEIIVSQDSWGGDFSWARITRSGGGWPSGFVHFNDVPLLNTAAPTVKGSLTIGSVLTAAPGTWTASATFGYQWTQNGVDIAGAKGATLKLASAQRGKKIAVRVSAASLGHASATAVSAPTPAVLSTALGNTVAPSVTGVPRTDATLTADPGTWDPAPESLRYQWLADAKPVAGATAASWRPGPAHVGTSISVTVTATRTGYADDSATSAATSPVQAATFTVRGRPTITGVRQLGRTLSVTAPATAPGTAADVLWMRDGSPVPGATGTTYRLGTADLGSRVSAQVRLVRPGYAAVTSSTVPTAVIRSTPVIAVTARPGRGRLTFAATVSARGVASVDGRLQVRARGQVLSEVPVRAGVAQGTVTHLAPGARTYRFRFRTAPTIAPGVVGRHLRIG
jgi:surface antigen